MTAASLTGRRGLVVGVANADSIAWGCARAFHRHGATLALSYQNARAEPHVRPLAELIGSDLVLPLDVEVPPQVDAAFDAIAARWGRLDFVLHAVAFAPAGDLRGPVLDCSADGFARAMRISCHSFIAIARRAAALMPDGGSLVTLSFYGAQKVVRQYNLMGPVKAALEATVRVLADELAPRGIRVHALSPGPVRTRAAGGLAAFDALLDEAVQRSPQRRTVTIEEVGETAAFLVGDGARAVTGGTIFVDGGRHAVA